MSTAIRNHLRRFQASSVACDQTAHVPVRTLAAVRDAVIVLLAAGACLIGSGCQRNANAPLPAQQAVPARQPVAQPVAPPLSAPAVAPASALVRHDEAAESTSAACLGGGQTASAPRAAPSIHRWTDASGIVHYSDQGAPKGAGDATVIAVNKAPPIAVHARGFDSDLPDRVEQRAATDALGVRRALHTALGVPAPNLAFDVVFVKSAENYAKLVDDPALASSAGAYSTARRTIYIRMQADDETGFTILRHELTHALIHDSVGVLPTAINEGLAEFFARMQVVGLGARVDVAADRASLPAAIPADGNDALVELLAQDSGEFYRVASDDASDLRQRDLRYTRAYALIATLMRNAQGRAALSAVLAAQRADACNPVAAEALLDQRYPGGLPALGDAWLDFMRNPPVEIDI